MACKPLTQEEQAKVIQVLDNIRDKALFVLGLKTGFRISELLSLTINDVYQANQIVARLKVQRKNMKGKVSSREVALHPTAIELLNSLLASYKAQGKVLEPTLPLFIGMGRNKPIGRNRAHKMLKAAYLKAGVTGSTGTHCMRKTFAVKVHKALANDLFKTQKALGHSSILTTVKYLPVEQEELDQAILA